MIDFLIAIFDEFAWSAWLCVLAVFGWWLGGKLPKL